MTPAETAARPARAGGTTTTIRMQATIMGNPCAMTVVDAEADVAENALALVRRLDALWSRFRVDSEITALNLAEGQPHRVSGYTALLIGEMQEAHRRTAGDYDPTLLPALVAHGYGASRIDPTRTTLLPTSAVAPGDMAGVRCADAIVTMPIGTTLDPGGIGKGLAADLAVAAALAQGARGALAQFGGDVVAGGAAPDGVGWRVGVEDPFLAGEHCDIVRIQRGAVATSSIRKLRWDGPGGRDAHHLIDPGSGAPVDTDVQTVTVIAATGARAESLTKSGLLRAIQDYLSWLPSQAAAGLVITADGRRHTSANWESYR